MKFFNKKFSFHLGPLTGLAILTILMTYPLVFHLKDHLPSDLGDPLHHVWLIGRNLAKLKEGLTNFWDGQIFYPHTKTVLYGDYVPALTVMAAFPAFLSKNLIFTYNFLWLLSFFLSGLGAYFLIFHLTRCRLSSFISSLIFAFSPVNMAHISHLELLFSAWLPLCFLFLHRYFKEPSLANLTWALFFLIFQTLSCGHYGVYAAFFMGLFGLILAFHTGLWKKPGFWVKTITAILGAAIILIPFFWPYFPVHEKMGFKWTFNDVRNYSAEIQNYLSAPSWNLIWGQLIHLKAPPERQVFLGLMPIILLILWLTCPRFFNPCYKPFFVKGLESWFNFKKKLTPFNKKFVFIYALNIIIFVLILDILIILTRGGIKLELAFFRFSSRRLINPTLLLLILGFLRLNLQPGWRQIKKKIREILIQKPEKSKTLPPSEFDFSPLSKLQIYGDLYFTMAIVSWLFSFGPIISFKGKELLIGPYNFIYQWIPFFKLMRAPGRFSIMVSLSLAVLTGLALASFLNSKNISWPKKPLLVIITGLILLEQISIPLPLAPLPNKGQIPEIYQTIARMPSETVLLELPLPDSRLNYYQESLPMYYSLFHRHRIVNGYSGFIPPAYGILQEAMETFPNEATVSLLERLKIDLILIHRNGYRPEKGKEIVEALKNWTDKFILIDQKKDDFLYRFVFPKGKDQIRPSLIEGSTLRPEERSPVESSLPIQLSWLKNKNMWKVWSGSNVVEAKKAIDNSLDTGWRSASRQKKDDFFWIDFGHEVILSEVRLYIKNKLFEYPRHFLIEISLDNIHWQEIATYENYFPYFDLENIEDLASYHVKIPLSMAKLRFLRIKLTAGHPIYHWSIQEIECLGKSDFWENSRRER